TTFNVHGGTDVMIVNDYDIANHLIPEEIYVVLELKKMGRKHIMQSWKAPSQNVAVQVSNGLLKDSSKVNLENT
ncbi:20616_t:CDS:2, partial [Entrophospora sp. SA101]